MMKHTLEMRNDYLRLVFPDPPTSLLPFQHLYVSRRDCLITEYVQA